MIGWWWIYCYKNLKKKIDKAKSQRKYERTTALVFSLIEFCPMLTSLYNNVIKLGILELEEYISEKIELLLSAYGNYSQIRTKSLLQECICN